MNAGERIAAFFDLDGTLLPPPSLEWRFIGWLIARDEIGGRDVARWLGRFAKTILRNPRGATLANKMYLAGLRESLAADWENSPAPGSLPLLAGGIERIGWHLARGHRVFFVSGTLGPLARAVARCLSGQLEVRATELESSGGFWTGRLAGEHLSGEAKARAVRALAARHGLVLSESYAYGNTLADLPMLESVGRPVAVNPRVGLERIACSDADRHRREAPRFGWQVCAWKESPSQPSAAERPHLYPISQKETR
ncbi:MAG: HAD family phosphatase [Candidatus Acidiferrales bacterium]|jgi:HAD superfamily hydrolase (TIGR01490 family)